MYNLPKREKTITVEPEDYEGVELEFATIQEEEAFEVLGEIGLTMEQLRSDDLEIELPPSAMGPRIRLMRRQLVGVKGLEVEGEPFDPDDPEHVRSLPSDMLLSGYDRLLNYPFMTAEVGKGSKGRDEPSPRGSTRPEPSRPAKAVS